MSEPAIGAGRAASVRIAPMHARRALAMMVAVVALAAGCSAEAEPIATPESVAAPQTAPAGAGGLGLAAVGRGLDRPLLALPRPGDDRLHVVEQGGLVRILAAGQPLPAPFLDLTDLTAADGERGLLGLAFHPEHAVNGLLYVNYTDSEGDTRVVEYRAGPGQPADPASARELLRVEQPYANHNGGHLAFGPDGMLYVGLGDGGSAGDPEDHGQRLDSLLGKLLRIDVDGRDAGLPYAIPPDNPFVGRADARGEIWALGLRNPWRFSFDPSGEALWIGDVGQNELEEIDRLPFPSGAGANLGWNRFEADAPFAPGPLSVEPAVPPVAQYPHGEECSVTGGYVYRGMRVPALRGRYVYGDFCSGRIWTLTADGEVGSPVEITQSLGGPLPNLSSFGTDAAGEIYAVAGDSVLRITAAG